MTLYLDTCIVGLHLLLKIFKSNFSLFLYSANVSNVSAVKQ